VTSPSSTTGVYTVLARRFRPQSFDEIVGQEHVGQALRNAIRAGRVAHAYLFTGARGVGKTSTARIFAKALNCPQASDGVPCNDCEICRGISEGHDVDVLEIDGASNRGIDDIRTLRANVNVKSMRSAHKVYIIDEVHMLTREAFNALLKTLEEPPPNVKFVFCTTEPNKVPDTILSRCQRFDFGTIATDRIAERLQSIAASEGIRVDDDAVDLVARRAAGSMRDSQSLFDQLLAFGAEHITTDDVHRLLGTAPDDRLIGLCEALIARDRCQALSLLDDALRRGVQLGPFSDQLLEYFRDLMVLLAGANDLPLMCVGNSARDTLRAQAERWGAQTIASAMQILVEAKGRMQRANYGRAVLELALVRIALLADLDDIAALIRQLSSGGPIAAAPQSAKLASTGQGRPSDTLRKVLQPGKPADGGNALRATTSPAELERAPPMVSVARTTMSDVTLPKESEQPAAVETPMPPPVVTPVTPAAEAQPESVPVATVSPVENPAEFLSQLVKQLPESMAERVRSATRIAIPGPNSLEIVFPGTASFAMNYCQRTETARKLQETVSQLAGRAFQVVCRLEVQSTNAGRPHTPSAAAAVDSRLRPAAVEKDTFVQSAVTIFGGTVVDVRRVAAAARVPASESTDPVEELEVESEA
jgi:DNA polymerase-3 subunit gamma/tau